MPTSTPDIQSRVLGILEEMTQDWEFDLDESIGLNTKLVADLNLASIDFIQLVVAIEDDFQQKLGFQDLLMSNGKYVDDLSVAQLIDFIDGKLNSKTSLKSSEQLAVPTTSFALPKIDAAKVAQFEQTIANRVAQFGLASHPSSLRQDTSVAKNPPAVFILSPPRSGSTLLRVILAGHPQLFAPPELHLLSYCTLEQRKTALCGEQSNHLLQGTVRAIMQIKNCSAEEAQSLMQEAEEQQMTTIQFYKLLQDWTSDRLLVDKTPTYASHLDILSRAETNFQDALYIHLLRHPYGMIRSYEESKLNQIVPILNDSAFTQQELAELTWSISHENILAFLKQVPEQRQLQIKFEDLVTQPQTTVENICRFLGLDFHPDMLEPYKEKNQRMTDGVNTVSEMSGDLKFHLHGGIDTDAAYRWQRYHQGNFLGDTTVSVAKFLGYDCA
jgi:acyl carrier protein